MINKWISLVSLYTLLFGFSVNSQSRKIDSRLEFEISSNVGLESSILDRTVSFKNYSTLLSALRASSLDKLLDYDGEFTVFAPSNVAFEKLSKITIDKLLDPKNKKVLTKIISYHIVASKLSASTILRAMSRGNGTASFTTIQGEKITATMRGLDILLTDITGNEAIIQRADFNLSNGIIHDIDTVFIPTLPIEQK